MTTPLEPWICVTEFYLVMLRRTTWFWALIIHSAAQCFGSTTSRQTPLLLLRSLSDIKDFPQSIFLSRPTRSLVTTPAKRLQHQTLRHLFTVNDSESIPVANREHKNNAQDDLWVCAYLMKTFVKFTTREPESRPSRIPLRCLPGWWKDYVNARTSGGPCHKGLWVM